MGHVAYVTEDRIGIITISRPSALNALNSQVLNELDRLETFGDISRWLETHLAARAARQAVEQEPETAAE